MTNLDQHTAAIERISSEIGEAAADLLGHLGSNGARLVGGVISDTVQVSRRWHELSFSVLLTSLRTAAQTVASQVQKVSDEFETK